jgi:hypothetical protein
MSDVKPVTEVTTEEFIHVARRASDEIKALRAQIALLTPKAQAYDGMMTILGLVPPLSRPMGVDFAYSLDRRIEALSLASTPAAPADEEA